MQKTSYSESYGFYVDILTGGQIGFNVRNMDKRSNRRQEALKVKLTKIRVNLPKKVGQYTTK